MTSKTPLPPYMPFPRFLLDMDLSETSRLLYSVLLDRARISQGKKKWTDRNGYVFLIYPIKALAESIHKSEMTVKTALSSLEKHDLIFRVRRGVGQPNLIYVKIPEDVPEGSLHSKDPLFEKQAFIPSPGSPLSDTDNHSFSQSETFPSKGQTNVCTAEKNLSISEKKNLTSGGLKTGCSEDKNLSFSHKESFPSERQETLCHADRKVSGNKNNIIKQIETNNRSNNYLPFIFYVSKNTDKVVVNILTI